MTSDNSDGHTDHFSDLVNHETLTSNLDCGKFHAITLNWFTTVKMGYVSSR
jgi:hypothetical protein